MDWFLYDREFHHQSVKEVTTLRVNKILLNSLVVFVATRFFCVSCKHWVQKRSSKLVAALSYKYDMCLGNINTESQSSHDIAVSDKNLEKVDLFSYLGDSVGQTGKCFGAATDVPFLYV